MSSSWTIKVNERSFGPYSLEQMRGFVGEGRLAPHSLVARDNAVDYLPAARDAVLAVLFQPAAAPVQAQPRPVFFTAEGDLGRGYAQREPEQPAQSRFVITADMKSGSIAGLEQEIMRCGQAIAVLPQVWLLTSDMAINSLRNTLIQKLGRVDMLFIVDTTRNKAAWSGFGPEQESRIRRLWQKAHEPQAA